VSVKLMSPNGDALWQGSQTVDGAKELTTAVDKLARQLRAKAGESLRTVRADPPLAQVTTSSFEALRKYSDGLRAYSVETDYTKPWRLLEEAVRLALTLAGAWVRLAAVL